MNKTMGVVKVRFQSPESMLLVDDYETNFSYVNTTTIDITSMFSDRFLYPVIQFSHMIVR